MEESFDDVIIMKVGPHSGMDLQEIIDSKNQEEKKTVFIIGAILVFFVNQYQLENFAKNPLKRNIIPKLY